MSEDSLDKIVLFVGIGNPGTQYTFNRHNAGFWFMDMLAEEYGSSFSYQRKLLGYLCTIEIASQPLKLFKPEVYVNESGRALYAVSQFYKIVAGQILIAHDEIDFPVGKIRLKKGGGHGGHNGLRSVIPQIGSNFWRLRIGIDHPGSKEHVVSHVLGNASQDERIEIKSGLLQVKKILPQLVSGESELAMNILHSESATSNGI